jgi:predicted PurR-regulated permease PerM
MSLVVLAALGVLLWALSPMLLPFVVGLALAYFLDPLVTAAAKRGVPRTLAALLTLLGFLLLFVGAGLLLAPLIQKQAVALLDALPSLLGEIENRLRPKVAHWLSLLSQNDVDQLRSAAGSYAGNAVSWAGNLAKGLITKGIALFDILTLVVVTPVVAFYLLRDWMKLKRAVDALVPPRYRHTVRGQIRAIDRALAGFMRGQALVCLCLGLIYGVGLTLVGLPYGATIGLIAGVLSFMPYVGSSFCLIASMLVACVRFDDPTRIGLVFLVFLIGQTLEGYVLTPKLVGDRVGLHPVWILFALFAGGTLMGFTGVLIAVPVAAALGVVIRFALTRYRASALYQN